MRPFTAAMFGAVALASASIDDLKLQDICDIDPDSCNDGVPLSVTDPCQVDPDCPDQPQNTDQIQDANEKTICNDG